jgi:hypothetical protein
MFFTFKCGFAWCIAAKLDRSNGVMGKLCFFFVLRYWICFFVFPHLKFLLNVEFFCSNFVKMPCFVRKTRLEGYRTISDLLTVVCYSVKRTFKALFNCWANTQKWKEEKRKGKKKNVVYEDLRKQELFSSYYWSAWLGWVAC